MSEQQNTESLDPQDMTPEQRDNEEKAVLRARLKTMGQTPSNNASLETLRAQLEAAMSGKALTQERAAQPMPGTSTPDAPAKPVSLHTLLRSKASKLRRVRITCHNPNKRDLPGEFFTVGNNYMGTIKRFVPFGETTDNGWHIEQAIYDLMKSRKYVDIRTKTVKGTGQVLVTTRLAAEFGIEDLPDLTPAELKQLATAQLAAGTSEVG
ncbi:hypothetical protein RIVERRIDER_75 [Xanthomonas phage RiverRider]|uniref:Uncharacterized protein n=1 Tax=Xanthomonas phage RiverRider TaxID=2108116 RepID=A0A2P1JUY4_9CAUD|nr:hypothetical protein HWB58_gp60 [Xanthomonas phage RiverRider]AVO23156.1 hypothetical protein RIVERRIDER_75 [Xanthomonas phage RiverRider]